MKKFWKLIFWLAALLAVTSVFTTPFDNPSVTGVLWLIASLFYLILMYGYAYEIPIGSKGMSIAVLILNTPAFVLGIYEAAALAYFKPSLGQTLSTAAAIGFVLLLLYPGYAYSFKSTSIWNQDA